MVHEQALDQPLLGNVADAQRHGIRDRADAPRDSLHEDLSRVGAVHPEDGQGQLGAARAQQPSDAENLARTKGEADVRELAGPGELSQLQDRLAGLAGGRKRGVCNLPPVMRVTSLPGSSREASKVPMPRPSRRTVTRSAISKTSFSL